MLLKCCTWCISKFKKTHLWPQDWKRSVLISIQKKGNEKECSNYCKLVLAPLRLYSKSFKSCFNSTWTGNLQMYKLGIEEAEEPDIKFSTSSDHRKSKGVSEKHLLLLHWLCETFDSVDHKNCGKLLKRWESQTTLPDSWETCMQVKKQQLELDMEQ